jgi:hypothetical protein
MAAVLKPGTGGSRQSCGKGLRARGPAPFFAVSRQRDPAVHTHHLQPRAVHAPKRAQNNVEGSASSSRLAVLYDVQCKSAHYQLHAALFFLLVPSHAA